MQPLSPLLAPSLRPPVLGERYAVVRLLGKGAQARVYLAWDRRTRTWVAAKVLSNDLLDDEEIRRRFEQEAHTMARLQHAHLLRVFDVGADGPVPWIIMELAAGGAITQWIRRNGVMPPAMAVAVTVQCAEGLDYAHKRGVVHRDIKPHNLLIVDNQRVVITDFGIAQAADASMTATGTVMGTFAYMAPEQRNDAKSVDGRADIYSLSATLYSMITGHPSAELFYAEADDDLLTHIPPALRPVLIKGCAYKREDRYATPLDFAQALVRASKGLPLAPAGTPHLNDDAQPLPPGPPTRIEPGALENLRQELGAGEDQPTYVPSSRDAINKAFESQQTAMYHNSSAGLEDAPTVFHRPTPDAALNDVEEASTMHPASLGPELAQLRADQDDQEGILKPTMLAIGVALGLLLTIWLTAVGSNVVTQWDVDGAANALVASAPIAESSLAALVDAGADETRLTRLWATYEADATPAHAADFADGLLGEAQRVQASPLAMSRIQPLADAATDYRAATVALEKQQQSILGRLSFGVGR